MYSIYRHLLAIAAIGLAIGTTGCINISPTPTYASTGDIVNVGLGGIKRNTYGTTLTKDDLLVTITSDADGVTHQVRVINLYRAFPDHTSQYAVQSQNRDHPVYKDVYPYDGQWWVTLQLADPASDIDNFLPLPLPAGRAVISISSAALIDTGWEYEGNLAVMPIDMVGDENNPGMARIREPTPRDFYLFAAYRPERTLTVQPDDLASVAEVGGMQIKLDYAGSSLANGTPLIPRLVPISHDPNINVIQKTVDNGDGTYSLVAMVTNPKGFVELDGGNWAIGKSAFTDLSFAITLNDKDGLNGAWRSRYALDPAESFFVDGNGDLIATVSPLLGRSY